MMTATIYFVQLTPAQVTELNGPEGGWSSPIGKAYLAAKNGKVDSTNFDLLERVATMDVTNETKVGLPNNEEVWLRLQNEYSSWEKATDVECFTKLPRSMDVGDIIVWANGSRFRCDSMGFERIGKAS